MKNKYYAVIFNQESGEFIIYPHKVADNPSDLLDAYEVYLGSFPSRKSAWAWLGAEEHIEMMESICSGNLEAVVPAAGGTE